MLSRTGAAASTRQLLAVLRALKTGDFSVRVPAHGNGAAGEIERTLNEVIELNERMARELERLNLAVGKDGKRDQRMALGDVSGGWRRCVDAVNGLIRDLGVPATDAGHVIGTVASGDPSQIGVAREVGTEDAVETAPHANDDDHARKPPTVPSIDEGERFQPGDRVLLIAADDVQVARVVLDSAHDCGFKAVVAANPDAGLSLTRKLQPTAIVLDARAPDMHGWVVLDQLKHDDATHHLPVVVAADDQHRRRALKMGAIGHVGRPERTALLAALAELARFIAQPRRLLVAVGGDDRVRGSLMALLGGDEIATTAVATAEDALAALGDHRFSCLAVDLGMPDMGLDLLHQLERNEDLRELPIIVHTNRHLTGYERARLKQLAETLLVKEVHSLERLLYETTRRLHRPEAGLSEPQRRMLRMLHPGPSLKGRTVLVIDDDVRSIFAIASVLEAHHATIVSAENGCDGLRLLETTRVDIVLMDIMMPEMDGYTVIRKIRAEPRFAALPIIAVTEQAMKTDRESCIQAGASDYIAKPFDLDKLLSQLRVWLSS